MTNESEEEIEKKKQDEAYVRYTKADDFVRKFATDVHGGLTPHGLLRIDFMNILTLDPFREIAKGDREEGWVNLSDVETVDQDDDLEKRKELGVLMSQEHAYSVAVWILSKTVKDGAEEVDAEEIHEVLKDAF